MIRFYKNEGFGELRSKKKFWWIASRLLVWQKYSNIIILKKVNFNIFFWITFLTDEVEECSKSDLQSILLIEDERINTLIDYTFNNYFTTDASFPPNPSAESASTTNRTTNS